jgi:6-phosphogluconate dehydrogenase
MDKQHMGMIGLGVMGRNLALNMERNRYPVAGYDLSPETRKKAKERFEGKDIKVYDNLPEFIEHLSAPRRIMLMVPAGKAVDSVIHDLKPFLVEGDLIIDGGNTYFEDTNRRMNELESTGILYIGTGVSGGEEGALWGPSIMPGGNPDGWPLVKPILQSIAAKVEDGTPCCDWVGSGGAGHFVKMVHNGIEYGDMQMICEAYFLMEKILKLTPAEMSEIFAEWNNGELNSYLIEISGHIMAKTDPDTGKPMIHVILDTAGQKGTGKWTSQVALDLGIPAITIASAVFARTLSAIKEERVAAARVLSAPEKTFSGDKKAFIEMIRQALYASKICSYAQGFQLLRAASGEYKMNLNYGNIALLWRAGCIIRARFLDNIKAAFDAQPDLPNLLLNDFFKTAIEANQAAWRKVVMTAVEFAIPVPAFSTALSYYDSYRSQALPANLLQAQRDYFGAHRYERVDQPRGNFFHTNWQQEGDK